MIISVNWLKKYLDVDVDIDKLTDVIGSRLVEIESVTKLADKYSSAIISKVVSCVPHPDSDHMHVCKIDDGGKATWVERDEDGYIQVVCGAPNVHEGMMVAWLPPTAIVPETYGKSDEFKLADRKLRGILSHGMLASPRELDLWNEHQGIMEIDADKAKSGDSLVDLFDLDDYLLEVENKSLTHRPDCFGVIGFTREVAAILGSSAKIPAWFNNINGELIPDEDEIKPTIDIVDPELCNRYECVVLDGVDSAKDLPADMRTMLSRIGGNSILAPVDITNWLMYETGQPLHAFDLDKLMAVSPTGKPDMVIRAAAQGEKLELLDGKTIELDPKDIVVAVGDSSNSVPVALAGAMGGMATEVTPDTKRILLESATFNLYNLRNTQFRHGIFGEAITRFTKGQPAPLTHPVLIRAVALMKQYAGAKAISSIIDNYPTKPVEQTFGIPVTDFTAVLGRLSTGDGYDDNLIESTLQNLQYSDVRIDGGRILAVAPWWRTDLHIKEDVIEDIGRVNGFDYIEKIMPRRDFAAAAYNELYQKQMLLRNRLREAGGNEVTTYSFIHGDLLDKVGDDKSKAYRIVNAISPDLQYYRRSLLPNLIECTRDNLKAGYDDFMLFELGKVHHKGLMDESEPTLPREISEVAGVVARKDSCGASAFYQIKSMMEYALNLQSGQLTYVRLDQYDAPLDSSTKLFEPKRSAAVLVDGNYVGVVGEFTNRVRQTFKLPDFAAGFNLLTEELLAYLDDGSEYTPVLRYQGTTRDITYQANDAVSYHRLVDFTNKILATMPDDMVATVSPLDIYRVGDNMRNVTLRIDFHNRSKTVDVKQVSRIMHKLEQSAVHELQVKVI